MNKNYTIARKKYDGEVTFINYSKLDGYKISPKNNIEYPGVEVNSILIIKPKFIEKDIKRSFPEENFFRDDKNLGKFRRINENRS